jgi:hypothetical protein
MKHRSRFGISSGNAGLIALWALLCAPPLMAQQVGAPTQTPPPASALKAGLEPLSFFVGQWNCEGEFTATKKPIASHVAGAPDLDGSWLAFRWDDKVPNQFHALELSGFDKAAIHFTNLVHDNFGGVRLFNSPGWDSDTLIWTGDLLAAPAALSQRIVIERKPVWEFVIRWETRKPLADWTVGDRLTCRQ